MNKLQTPWKLYITAFFFTVLVWTPRIVHAAPTAQTQAPANETVRIMVKVDAATQNADEMSILSQSTDEDNSLSQVGWDVIEVDAAVAAEVIAELRATQGVVEVTPDYPLELAWKPNDPSYADGSQWSIDKIGADVAWEFSAGQAITVAVIDSGIDPNHPDLAGRIVPGYNFIDKNTDTTDLCGHGTHVSGIIAAATDNNVGVAGVAPEALIMPVKVIGENCLGSYSRLMQGILYAVDQGVRIISITSGGGFEHDGLHDAIVYAQSKGVLVVVAAGNRGNDLPFYPGSFEESFTVSGTDENDGQYVNSNFGQQVDISAPAVSIFNTYYNKDQGSTYAYLTGTSMAAPHVAAVAALVLAIDPKMPLADLENALITSATDLGDAGWDAHFGWGRLTAWRAVAAVSPAAGNVRLGHFRIPNMDDFAGVNFAATSKAGSVELNWTEANIAADESVVIYRSIVPVFEGAVDIAEVEATATGIYSDTDVEVGQEYYYWLVQSDGDVEVAITDMLTTTMTSAPAEPQEPQEPEEPVQTEKVAIFMPLLQR